MTKYAVDITETVVYQLTVEADNAETAEDRVEEIYINNDANPEQAGFKWLRGDRETFAHQEG
jgi:hypothetical protein